MSILPSSQIRHPTQLPTVRSISVFGLGYVGCVSAACLTRDGHSVIGVDVNPQKLAQLRAGQSPIIEPGLAPLLRESVEGGRLTATDSAAQAVRDTDISLVCVGTPSRKNGSLDLQFLQNVCAEIGRALAQKSSYHVVVIRSTVLPGTTRKHLIPILEEQSSKVAGRDFGVCMNPEFLREGSAVDDYDAPSHIVIGEIDAQSGHVVEEIYRDVDAECVHAPLEMAEMVKYVNNAFHALKVSFANEIGTLCKTHGVDGHEVMEIFCQDERLNISPAYLKPGFAFGGSCLPKDLRALTYNARQHDIQCSLLEATLASNQHHLQRGIALVESTGQKRVGVLGLSFKANTDDVRESPVVPLIETLIGRGFCVTVYDENVDPNQLIGSNRAYLQRELPHIATLMRDSVANVLADADVVVVANNSRAFAHVVESIRPDQTLVDLVGLAAAKNGECQGTYLGMCW